jgi:hypothetical protein
MENDSLYKHSWEVYKAHSELFDDDFDYYLNFCKGKKTLELFAGYGRLANYLSCQGVDIECVELESNFAKFIDLAQDKVHVCSVLDFKPASKFDRIVVGYNSFCLLIRREEILLFFKKLASWLVSGGKVALSYYDHNAWQNTPGHYFNFRGKKIEYIPGYDLTKRNEKRGVWIDEYKNEELGIDFKHTYPLRLYEGRDDILPFIEMTGLTLIEEIKDYNKKDISDSGWIEYVFEKC